MHFESSKTMSFKISDNKLLKEYTQIWKKVKNLLNIKFDSKPVYGDNDKYIKTKRKIYDNNVNTNFHGKKVPRENASYKCLSLIMLDSVVKVKKKYYPQTLLEECKYEIKKTKMESFINDEFEVHPMMKVIVTLIMILIMRLAMNLAVRLIMNNLLKVKTVF